MYRKMKCFLQQRFLLLTIIITMTASSYGSVPVTYTSKLYYDYASAIMVVLAIFIIILRLKVRDVKKKLEEKNKCTSLALKAGEIGIWGYSVKKRRFYNVDCNYFPKDGLPYEKELERLHPDDRGIFEKAIHDASQGQDANTIYVRMDYTQSGSWRYVQKDIAPFRARDGVVTSVIGTHRDVTDTILKQKKINALNKHIPHCSTVRPSAHNTAMPTVT